MSSANERIPSWTHWEPPRNPGDSPRHDLDRSWCRSAVRRPLHGPDRPHPAVERSPLPDRTAFGVGLGIFTIAAGRGLGAPLVGTLIESIYATAVFYTLAPLTALGVTLRPPKCPPRAPSEPRRFSKPSEISSRPSTGWGTRCGNQAGRRAWIPSGVPQGPSGEVLGEEPGGRQPEQRQSRVHRRPARRRRRRGNRRLLSERVTTGATPARWWPPGPQT